MIGIESWISNESPRRFLSMLSIVELLWIIPQVKWFQGWIYFIQKMRPFFLFLIHRFGWWSAKRQWERKCDLMILYNGSDQCQTRHPKNLGRGIKIDYSQFYEVFLSHFSVDVLLLKKWISNQFLRTFSLSFHFASQFQSVDGLDMQKKKCRKNSL